LGYNQCFGKCPPETERCCIPVVGIILKASLLAGACGTVGGRVTLIDGCNLVQRKGGFFEITPPGVFLPDAFVDIRRGWIQLIGF
jgi:hypothetical protein